MEKRSGVQRFETQGGRFNPYGAYVTIPCPPSFPPMSPLCAQISGLGCKNRKYKKYNNTKLTKTWTILLYSAKICKRIGSEIRKFGAFKDGDCRFGARVRRTAGARSCCTPELLALKGLNISIIVINNDKCPSSAVSLAISVTKVAWPQSRRPWNKLSEAACNDLTGQLGTLGSVFFIQTH